MCSESSPDKTEKTAKQPDVHDPVAEGVVPEPEVPPAREAGVASTIADAAETAGQVSEPGDEAVTTGDSSPEPVTDDGGPDEVPVTEDGDGAAEPTVEVDEATMLRKTLTEFNDKYIRLLAEFENFKRRSAQELQTRFRYANQGLALSTITGLDNLERAITQANEEENESLKEFVTGVEMVLQQFYDAFAKNDIERIFPLGEPFDPNRHEAVSVVETDTVEPDHIAEVFQAGYILHDRVIRPAMVQVAKKQ